MEINLIPGEKLLIKIWESLVDKGIGGLLTPGQIRREGKARAEVRREEMLVLTQAEKDVQDIIGGKKKLKAGQLVELRALSAPGAEPTKAIVDQQHASPRLLADAAKKFSAREVQRHINLQRIAVYAEEQATRAPDEQVSDEPVDSDWLNRWRENAQDVSAEHMQRVWARILAEEVKSPGSYRMGTLEFLRSLSKPDALKIAAVGPFVVDQEWIFRDQEHLRGKGLPFGAMLELQEMGIVSGVESIGLNRTVPSAENDKFLLALVSCGKALVIERDAKEPPLSLSIYRITHLGREILGLGDYSPDEGYLKHLGNHIKSKGFKVRCGDWTDMGQGRGMLSNSIEL